MKKTTGLLLVALLVIGLFAFSGGVLAKDDIRVAAVYTTPIEEPWDGAIHKALEQLSEEMGFYYEYTEKVGPTDYERALREYANQGFDVIFGDIFNTEEIARRVAADYPEVYFVHGSSLGPQEPNMGVFDDWIHEPAYLCGIIAGSITETDVLGVVGGYPIPEVNRLINAFKAGAKEVNPDVQVKIAFIGSWYDPSKAKEFSVSMIEQGADVLYAERYGVIQAAQEHGIWAFGNIIDQYDLAPGTVITGPVWDMYPLVKEVVTSVMEGNFKAIDYREWTMMQKGGAHLAPWHGMDEKLPAEVVKMVEELKTQILNGEFVVPVDPSEPVSD
ncbi:MAG: BMP family protein [Halanaerobium sp.]|nr:BMP family protein [Halanaerobium sp.]